MEDGESTFVCKRRSNQSSDSRDDGVNEVESQSLVLRVCSGIGEQDREEVSRGEEQKKDGKMSA